MSPRDWNDEVRQAREEFSLPDMPSIEDVRERIRQRDMQARDDEYQDALRTTKQSRKHRHEDYRRFPPLPVEMGAPLPRRRRIDPQVVLVVIALILFCFLAAPFLALL